MRRSLVLLLLCGIISILGCEIKSTPSTLDIPTVTAATPPPPAETEQRPQKHPDAFVGPHQRPTQRHGLWSFAGWPLMHLQPQGRYNIALDLQTGMCLVTPADMKIMNEYGIPSYSTLVVPTGFEEKPYGATWGNREHWEICDAGAKAAIDFADEHDMYYVLCFLTGLKVEGLTIDAVKENWPEGFKREALPYLIEVNKRRAEAGKHPIVFSLEKLNTSGDESKWTGHPILLPHTVQDTEDVRVATDSIFLTLCLDGLHIKMDEHIEELTVGATIRKYGRHASIIHTGGINIVGDTRIDRTPIDWAGEQIDWGGDVARAIFETPYDGPNPRLYLIESLANRADGKGMTADECYVSFGSTINIVEAGMSRARDAARTSVLSGSLDSVDKSQK